MYIAIMLETITDAPIKYQRHVITVMQRSMSIRLTWKCVHRKTSNIHLPVLSILSKIQKCAFIKKIRTHTRTHTRTYTHTHARIRTYARTHTHAHART